MNIRLLELGPIEIPDDDPNKYIRVYCDGHIVEIDTLSISNTREMAPIYYLGTRAATIPGKTTITGTIVVDHDTHKVISNRPFSIVFKDGENDMYIEDCMVVKANIDEMKWTVGFRVGKLTHV